MAHGTFQGSMAAIQGGKFWSGFAAGAVSSIVSTAMGALASSGEYSSGNYNVDGSCEVRNFGMDHNGLMKAGTLVAGAITGGAAAALSKGYFWDGAVTGLFVAGFNHLGHSVGDNIRYRKDLISRMKKGNIDPQGKPDFSTEGVERMNAGVEGLQEDYIAAGSPKVRFDLTGNRYEGDTNPGDVNLNKSLIKNNYRYASVLFHEYRHAWQYIYKWNGWVAKYGADTAYNLMERDAYGYTIQTGIYNPFDVSDSIIKENFDLYYNLTNHIKHF